MAIWTAFHSKYKLGGFIPLVTWAPLINVYDYPRNPENQHTPILYMNGNVDPIVPPVPAFYKTEALLNEYFTDVDATLRVGEHLTTPLNPINRPKISSWMCANTNLHFDALHPSTIVAKVANGGWCKGGSSLANPICLIPFLCRGR